MDQNLKIDPIYVDLHKRVMKQIETDEAHWNQRQWIGKMGKPKIPEPLGGASINSEYYTQEATVGCDTTYCYAGHALAQEGYKFDQAGYVIVDGHREDPQIVAAKILGLTDDQARQIFFYEVDQSGNHPTVNQIKARVARVTGIKFD